VTLALGDFAAVTTQFSVHRRGAAPAGCRSRSRSPGAPSRCAIQPWAMERDRNLFLSDLLDFRENSSFTGAGGVLSRRVVYSDHQ